MNRVDRLTAILIQLQSKKIVKASEIAERFDISLRTVYRDIRALEEAGVPIGSDAGIGYYLADDYHLPPVRFTTQEASALITAGKLMAEFSDRQLKKHFDSALYKIKAILGTKQKDYLENLENVIAVYKPSNINTGFGTDFLADIQGALAGNNLVLMEYYSSAGQITSRWIEPISLGFYDSNWYLIAFCRLRNAYRNFRVDRIRQLSVTNGVFDRKKHGTLEKVFSKIFSSIQLQEVIFRIAKSASCNLIKDKCHYGLVTEKDLGSKVEITLLVDSLRVLGKWLINYGQDVEIISPDELKTVMKQYAGEIRDQYLG